MEVPGGAAGRQHGWFRRAERSIYEFSPKGREVLVLYADVVQALAGRCHACQTPHRAMIKRVQMPAPPPPT